MHRFLLTLLFFIVSSLHCMEIPHYPVSKETRDEENMTPLMHAVEHNNYDNAKKLIKDGANVNATNTPEDPAIDRTFPDGKTPLVLAIVNGNKKIVKLLLKHKASPNQPNRVGCTPLQIAASMDQPSIVKLLTKYGGDNNMGYRICNKTVEQYAQEFFNSENECHFTSSIDIKEWDSLNLECYDDYINTAQECGYAPDEIISDFDASEILQKDLNKTKQEVEEIYKKRKSKKPAVTFEDIQPATKPDTINPKDLRRANSSPGLLRRTLSSPKLRRKKTKKSI